MRRRITIRAITRRIARTWRISYALAFAPLLGMLVARHQKLHRRISAPLLGGPYRGYLLRAIQGAIYELECGNLSHEELVGRILDEMCAALRRDEFDSWFPSHIEKPAAIVLSECYGYAPGKRWHLKLHIMPEGNKHRLHAHRDVCSAQVVARGKLHVQEFELVDRIGENKYRLKTVRNEVLMPLEGFVTTDRATNVHGFVPVGGPALRLQFNLRGYGASAARLFPQMGRLYLRLLGDPRPENTVLAELVSETDPNNILSGTIHA